jgi:hypothetical protein
MSRQTCKAVTVKEEKWKICKWQIFCPRNQKTQQTSRQTFDRFEKLGHPIKTSLTGQQKFSGKEVSFILLYLLYWKCDQRQTNTPHPCVTATGKMKVQSCQIIAG